MGRDPTNTPQINKNQLKTLLLKKKLLDVWFLWDGLPAGALDLMDPSRKWSKIRMWQKVYDMYYVHKTIEIYIIISFTEIIASSTHPIMLGCNMLINIVSMSFFSMNGLATILTFKKEHAWTLEKIIFLLKFQNSLFCQQCEY